MDTREALNVLEMFLYKDCSLARTKFAYDQNTVWQAVKMATEALEASQWIPISERPPEVGQIVIKGMEMPKTCEECPILRVEEFEWEEDDGYWEWEEWKTCPLIDDHINNEKDTRCPLIEVKNDNN